MISPYCLSDHEILKGRLSEVGNIHPTAEASHQIEENKRSTEFTSKSSSIFFILQSCQPA
jgi:hypothetical protein